MKNYDKNKFLEWIVLDVNNLYGWAMSQKLPADNFKWVEETSQFMKDFIKIYNEDSNTGYFIEADLQYPKKCINFIMTYTFLPKRMEIEKIEKFVGNLRNKKCYTYMKLKASIKSRISIEKSA